MAIAAVDELIIHGLPVMNAATSPMTIAVCKLINGLTPATNANATASGIRARATVIPDNISSLICFFSLGNQEKRKEISVFIRLLAIKNGAYCSTMDASIGKSLR